MSSSGAPFGSVVFFSLSSIISIGVEVVVVVLVVVVVVVVVDYNSALLLIVVCESRVYID